MTNKTILALSAAIVLGSASTALAQFYAPDVAPGPYAERGYYAQPYPGYGTPNNYWMSNRRSRSVGRAPGDTNGF
jgi:hypothetical protein